MALTQAQIQTAFVNSLGRQPSANELSSFFAVSQSGAVNDAGIINAISNSTEANQVADPVVRFYESAFGRVPDQAGLQNAENYIRAFGASAQTYQNLAVQFTQSQEFQNRFGAGTQVDSAYVTALYQTILGRTPSSSEVDGYTSGSNGFTTRAQVLYAISQSNEAQGISNTAVNGFLANAAQGVAVYTGDLYTAQNGAPNGPQGPGSTFTFTTSIDVLTGTGNADVFVGDANTVTAADSVNGGAGTDTFNYVGATGAVVLPQITNVEKLAFTNPTGAVAVNTTNVTGLTDVTTQNVVTGSTFTVAEGTKVTLGGTGTVAAETVTTTATATTESIGLTGGITLTALTANGAAVKTLSLDSSGSAANTITTLDGTAGASTTVANQTLNLTGSQKLTITNALDTDFTTVNASTDTGGVSLKFGANDVSVTGGAGNDKFAFDANLTTADTVVGGAGTDTVSVTGADFSTVAAGGTLAALNTKVTGVEVLEFTGTAATTINGNTFTNAEVTKILFNTSGAGVVDTIDNAGSARTYAFGELNAGDAVINGKADVTSFNVSLEGITGNGGDVGALTANFTNSAATQVGTGTINLASTGTNDAAAPNTTGIITAQSNAGALTTTAINVTGSHDLTIGGVATKATIDASAFTGKLVVSGSAAGDTFTLGSGADTVNETVNGVGGATATSSTYTNLDTINSFTKADTLTVGGITFAANGSTLTKFDASNAVSFEQALTSAEQTTDATKAAYFNYGGNTFVVSNTDTANTAIANGSTDVVVKLAGVQTLTSDAAGIHGA